MPIKELVSVTKNQLKTLRGLVYRGIYTASGSAKSQKDIVDSFHQLYFDSGVMNATWTQSTWFGVPVLKCPFDLMVYQEMLFELKPDLIIETGTAAGGSALFMATLLDSIGKGKIITIDIENRNDRPSHPRITYLTGSSTDPTIVSKVEAAVRNQSSVMVILDSDHSKAHVQKELDVYRHLVTKGNYLVVEDSNINGHPVSPDFGPGPMEAIEEFLKETEAFVVDKRNEKHLMTFNPKGCLKKIK